MGHIAPMFAFYPPAYFIQLYVKVTRTPGNDNNDQDLILIDVHCPTGEERAPM
jgi:hypothetical protein